MTYRPDPAFAGLFNAFTGGPACLGAALGDATQAARAGAPLLVTTASDIALFPGAGAAPVTESFRKSTRGFIELTAISHLPLALAYLSRLRALQTPGEGDGEGWRMHLRQLVEQAEATRAANSAAMWREQVALQAFSGIEQQLADMVDYTIAASLAYLRQAEADPALLAMEALRERYFDAPPGVLPVRMNDIMFATFCLAYVDIAYRIGNWVRAQPVDWGDAMVLVTGQSGRPTAGVTWASNNMCNLIWRATECQLHPEQVYLAPHAPGFSVEVGADAAALARQEQDYRALWCRTRASVEVSREMFAGYPGFQFEPSVTEAMPPIRGLGDREACVARLRRIMEDPQQLLSNGVADHVVDELRRHGNRPDRVQIPGFTGVDFARALREL